MREVAQLLCGVVAPLKLGMELLVELVVIVVVGAIVVAGAIEVGARSLVIGSLHESISASDFMTPSIILGTSS